MKLRDVKKLARGHTAGSAGAEVEGGFPDSSSAVAVSAAAACAGRGGPRFLCAHPSSLLAVRLLQGSPGRPDHRCRPRSLVGVARPAPTSPPSGNLRLTRLFPDGVPQAALGAGPVAASQTQALRLAVLLLGIGRIAHCPAETNRPDMEISGRAPNVRAERSYVQGEMGGSHPTK